jgi:hypothetical protein
LLRRPFAIFDGGQGPKGHLTTNRAIADVGKTRSQFRRADFRFTLQSRHPGTIWHVRKVPILLQKSKVASVRIFGETLKREAIDDSDNLSRVTEVAYEFSVRR